MNEVKKYKRFLLSMKGSGSVVCDDKEEIAFHISELEELEVGDEFTVKVAEFTDKELQSMPEFDGF
jgi:hypothetical protein